MGSLSIKVVFSMLLAWLTALKLMPAMTMSIASCTFFSL
jgi:hypothetical protein